MRSLRFVHLAGDGTHLVLETADGGEQFVLAADPDVRHAFAGTATGLVDAAAEHVHALVPVEQAAAELAASSDAPTPPVEISPREIQTRVRAGESPADVAAALGTTVERIARFAGPVVEERRRIADEARRARARRITSDNREAQLLVFGEMVDERFAAHGVAPIEVAWDAHRRDDGDWVVRAEWQRGEMSFGATWIFHRSSRTVTALDDAAGDLLSDRPIRPVLPAEPKGPALAPGVVAFPPMPDALTGPIPVVEDVFDQDASDAEHPFSFALQADPVDFDEPPLPLGIVDPSTRPGAPNPRLSPLRVLAARHEHSDEERAERVKVPSWDDILLGVRRKQD